MATDIVNTKTGMGAAIGGLIGFICAGPMGAGIGALVGGGVAHASDQTGKGQMTSRRQMIYERALKSVSNPADLTKLADAFAGEGLEAEADVLRRRAALRSLPADVKDKRRAFFRRAMASDNTDLIQQTADAFAGEGALGAATALTDHADAVRAAHLAGKSTKAMANGAVERFADKLAKAILHFGPETPQAQSAAGNLIRAKGKQPSPKMVADVIRVAAKALEVQAPPAATPASQVEIDGRDPNVVEASDVPEATDDVPPAEDIPAATVAGESGDKGVPEPTVVGPPAPKVEPPAEVEAARAATVDVGVVANESDGGMANEGASPV